MTKTPKFYGIIPARYGSSRFPGKPLAQINGKPMLWHVYNRAYLCRHLSQVILATDDERIYDTAKNLNINVVMTKKDHPSGTDRVLEAAKLINAPDDSVIINIQGDEPVLEPQMLTELIEPFHNPDVRVTTLAKKLNPDEAQNPDRVKVIFDKNGKALYFSRAIIPYQRGKVDIQYYGHIGLYAFRMDTLKQFVKLGEGTLEKAEKLEQLRLLENGIPIHVVETLHQSIGVDRPEDIIIVSDILNKNA